MVNGISCKLSKGLRFKTLNISSFWLQLTQMILNNLTKYLHKMRPSDFIVISDVEVLQSK